MTVVPIDDFELIRQTLDGRTEAFEGLMRRYERLVFKVAWGFGGSRDDALDITQTVFMKVYRSLGSFRVESNFKTWLLRITYNEGINWLRQTGSRDRQRQPIDDAAPELRSTNDPEDDLLESDQKARLERGLRTLNERYRTAIHLRYFQGLPIREIAAVLQCSETMTKNILFRGVRRLRKVVGEPA